MHFNPFSAEVGTPWTPGLLGKTGTWRSTSLRSVSVAATNYSTAPTAKLVVYSSYCERCDRTLQRTLAHWRIHESPEQLGTLPRRTGRFPVLVTHLGAASRARASGRREARASCGFLVPFARLEPGLKTARPSSREAVDGEGSAPSGYSRVRPLR